MDPAKSILFICHESSRTGAPLFLLYFLRWIRKNTDSKILILIEKGGEMEEAFRELGPVFLIRPAKPSLFQKFWYKFHYRSYFFSRTRGLRKEQVGLVYLNTFSNGMLAEFLKNHFNCQLITHSHELESVIRSTGKRNIMLIRKFTDHFIAASGAVRDNLIKNHGIPPDKISIFYECIEPVEEGNGSGEDVEFVVGGAGFVDDRKGFDLFLETAFILINRLGCKNLRFIWVGDFGRHKRQKVTDYIRDHGLARYVEFTGPASDPFPFYRRFQLFFLSSREDPFPLVMLENAFLGKPIVGFRGTGGLEEFLGQEQELLVEPFDTLKMAYLILGLINSPERIKAIGARLKNKVAENHLIEKCGRAYYDRIRQLASSADGQAG